MPKDHRTFITVHDGMPEHRKIEVLSDKAFRCLFDLWCWCSRTRSDGHVPEAVWRKRTTPRVAREFLEGPFGPLAEAVDGGYYMHDYLEHQRSREEIEQLTEKRRLAGSNGGKAKAERQASAVASATARSRQRRGKSVAETDTELPEPDGSGSDEPTAPSTDLVPSAQTLVAEWIDHCGTRPPSRVVGQVSKELGVMLAEGIPYEDVRRGFAAWHAKALHPSAIASVVHETRNPRTARTTDRQADILRLEMERAQAADAEHLEIGV